MKNWQALSVVFLACINFVYQAVIHCTVLSKRDSWDVFQLGEEFTECMKKTSFSKGNKVMEGVLGTTYFELYLALQEFCNYRQHLPDRWALPGTRGNFSKASANLLNNIFDTIFYCPVGQRSQALALLNAEQIVIRRARDFLKSKWSDIFAVLKIILFEVDSVMNSFTDVIFTYKMMVSF